MTKLIPLSKSGKHRGKFFAIVDDDMFEELNRFNWQVSAGNSHYKKHYAQRDIGGRHINGEHGWKMPMHEQIMGEKGIDHIDGNELNNTRKNLRKATPAQNAENRAKTTKKVALSKYKGVTFHRKIGKWQSQIKLSGKSIYLGVHNTQESAARAYDAKALELFGEFARLNFQQEQIA